MWFISLRPSVIGSPTLLVSNVVWLVALCTNLAYAQSSPWQVQVSDTGDVVASSNQSMTVSNGRTLNGLLNIGFGSKGGCLPELGVAVLTGDGYGKPVGKYSPPNTTSIRLTVDSTPVATDAPYVVRYENGFEAIVRIDTRIVQTLTSGAS